MSAEPEGYFSQSNYEKLHSCKKRDALRSLEDYPNGKEEGFKRELAVIMFSRSFDVDVCHDHEDKVWVAQCDALGLVTEAATHEELTGRVWEIAPELYGMNSFTNNPSQIGLSFILNCEDEEPRKNLNSEHC